MANALRADLFTPDELRAVLAAIDYHRAGERDALVADRNRALIAVLWRAGLRCGEALALAPDDVDFERGLIRVRRSKTRAGLRLAAIDEHALKYVRAWIDSRSLLRFAPDAPLFCTHAGTALDARYVRALVKRLASRAGIRKRLHPHGLRHAHAVELRREGVELELIRDQLGHATIASTDAYLRRYSPDERVAAVRSRNW